VPLAAFARRSGRRVSRFDPASVQEIKHCLCYGKKKELPPLSAAKEFGGYGIGKGRNEKGLTQ